MYGHKSPKTSGQSKKIDFILLLLPVLLCCFGMLMIFEASNVPAFNDFGNKYHFLKEQFGGFIFGLISMIFVSYIPYKLYYKLALPILIATIVLLFAVFLPGIGIKAYGAYRWVNLGVTNFQPSELAKLSLILYLSAWLSNKEKGRLTAFLLLMLLMVGLIIIQPDLGTAIILMLISITIYFISGAPLWHFGMMLPISVVAVLFLAITSPYRYQRLTTFFNPNADPLGASYHIRQILISLGSGGFWGVGLGDSKQKYQYLPEATTDSIFAIVGEEFGFLGSFSLIIIYILFLQRIIKLSKNVKDTHGRLITGGIFAFFACQSAVNLGSMVALIPLTGVPLPFISYGGSNLLISMVLTGILLNVSKNR